MSVQTTLKGRFLEELKPTKIQILACVVLALGILVVAQRPSFVWLSGTNQGPIVDASVAELHDRVSALLTTQVASTSALIAFWAIIGLVAYLVCWIAYNFLIEARNKVTLETAYTNRGHWRGAYETLILKALCALALCATLVLLEPAVEYWSALVVPILSGLTIKSGLLVLAATFGLAVHLYAILTCVILTFSPWYRPEAFTDAVE